MDRVAKRFLTNTDGIYALVLHIDSWPEKHGVKKDIGIIPIHDVICGPILSMFLSTLRQEIRQYRNIKCLFEIERLIEKNYTEKKLKVNEYC